MQATSRVEHQKQKRGEKGQLRERFLKIPYGFSKSLFEQSKGENIVMEAHSDDLFRSWQILTEKFSYQTMKASLNLQNQLNHLISLTSNLAR